MYLIVVVVQSLFFFFSLFMCHFCRLNLFVCLPFRANANLVIVFACVCQCVCELYLFERKEFILWQIELKSPVFRTVSYVRE